LKVVVLVFVVPFVVTLVVVVLVAAGEEELLLFMVLVTLGVFVTLLVVVPDFLINTKYTMATRMRIHMARMSNLVVVQKGCGGGGGVVISSSLTAGRVSGGVVTGGAVVIGLRASKFPEPRRRSGLTGNGKTTLPVPPYGLMVG